MIATTIVKQHLFQTFQDIFICYSQVIKSITKLRVPYIRTRDCVSHYYSLSVHLIARLENNKMKISMVSINLKNVFPN